MGVFMYQIDAEVKNTLYEVVGAAIYTWYYTFRITINCNM